MYIFMHKILLELLRCAHVCINYRIITFFFLSKIIRYFISISHLKQVIMDHHYLYSVIQGMMGFIVLLMWYHIYVITKGLLNH